MTDDVEAIVGKLTAPERDLLCGRCDGWGSWMFTAGHHMISLGLGTEHEGSISFNTPLGLAVRDHLLKGQP